jgi:S1-C subfamily serine protease
VDSGIKVNDKDADIIAVDPQHDLALLQVETEECQLIHLGEVDYGELVFSVANPLSFTGALMFGHVCFQTEKRIVHDMHGAPGVSGSGLFNNNGELVGVNHSVAGHKHIGSSFTMAVPVLEMRSLLSKAFHIIQPTAEEIQKYGVPDEETPEE